MTFAAATPAAQFGSNASAATVTLSPSATILAGTLFAVNWVANVASLTVSSVADNSSQSGRANSYSIGTPRSGTTLSHGTVYCLASRNILATDVITITLSAVATRRGATLRDWTLANGMPVLDKSVGVTADTSSPVTLPTSGTLAAADELAIAMRGWLGGAVASGYAHTTPAGFTNATSGLSAGVTTRVEANMSFDDNLGASTAFADDATYTSITRAHGELLTFLDVVVPTAPAAALLDDFNAGATQLLTARAGWSATGFASAGNISWRTDAVPTVADNTNTPATAHSNMWGTQFAADQEAGFTYGAAGTPDDIQIVVRGAALGNGTTAYELYVRWNGELRIQRDGTVLARVQQAAPTAGDSYCLQAIGSTLYAWCRRSGGSWVCLLAVIDTTYSGAGYIGFEQVATGTATVTEFFGGAISSDATDSGSVTGTLTQTSAEALSDPGAITATLTPSAALQGASDAGTNSAALTQTGAEAVRDTASVTATITTSGTHSVASDVTDSGFFSVGLARGDAYPNETFYPDDQVFPGALLGDEALRDQATNTVTVTQSGTESVTGGNPTDAGTCSLTLTPTGAEALRDASTNTVTITQSGSERIADAGATTATLTTSGADAPADSATNTVTVTQTSTERIVDAGTNAGTLTPSAAEAISDAGGIAGTVTPSGALEAFPNAGGITATVTQTASEALRDGATNTTTIDPTGVGGVLGADPSDAGTCTVTLTPSATEILVVSGAVTVTITQSAGEAAADAGSTTGTLTTSGTYGVGDAATVTAALTTSGGEALSASAANTTTVSPSATEALADAASTTASLTPSSADALLDAAVLVLGITLSATEILIEAATLTIVVDPTGIGGMAGGDITVSGEVVLTLIGVGVQMIRLPPGPDSARVYDASPPRGGLTSRRQGTGSGTSGARLSSGLTSRRRR